MIRPTPRAVGVYAAGIPFGFLAVIFDQALWPASIAAASVILATIAADAAMILRRARVGVTVSPPRRLAIGDTGHVDVGLTVPRRARTAFTLVLEEHGATDEAVTVLTQSDGGRAEARLPVCSARRGTIRLEALWLRWRGPLGLVEQRWRTALDHGVIVVPAIRGARGTALGALIRDARRGDNTLQQQGEGFEFDTLRDHASGLDNRHIDWKRSARHAKLVSKVFTAERSQTVVLAFDTGHLMREPVEGKARLDHAIEAGLLLGWTSLRNGDLVGGFAFDAHVRSYIAPAAGLHSLQRLQDGGAALPYTTEETNFTLGLAEINQRLKRRAMIVLFTEFVDTITAELLIESLARIANKHAVIFVTLRDPFLLRLRESEPAVFDTAARAVIAHDVMRERAVVLERVARLGVHVLDTSVHALPAALVGIVRSVKRRGEL